MTNEEVIRIAQGLITDFKCDSEMMVDFCNTVIKKFEQQTSDDCVSRNTLKRAVSELTYWHPTADGRLEVGGAFDNTVYKVEDVWRLTRELPSVTLSISKGEWLHIYKSGIACECSRCHIQMPITEYYHFCPNCGAFMMESEESE